jgi:hypothetical protein
MFVAFADIEEPNVLTEIEARQLHTELLMGTPSVTHRQVAKKIQRGWEQTGEARTSTTTRSASLSRPSTGDGQERR